MIKLVIVDDHAIIRTGLKRIFELYSEIEVVGEANCGESLLELLPQISVDLILLDISMPGINGIDAIAKIKHLNPNVLILY